MTRSLSRWCSAFRLLEKAALAIAAIGLFFPATMFAQWPYEYPEETAASAKAAPAKSVDPRTQQNVTPTGLPSSRVEVRMGPLNVRLYGTLLLNISASDANVAGQDLALWAVPGSSAVPFPDGTSARSATVHDTVFSARQSVFGLNFTLAEPPTGWGASGVIELDFFGSRPVDTFQPQARVLNQPRLRLAYFQLENGPWRIVAGQDRAILAPLDPISLSHVAAPLGATAGNLWARLPQVRLDATRKFTSKTSVLFQVGLMRPLFADPRLSDLPSSGTAVDNTSSGLGERASHPFYQARVALSHPISGFTATYGVSAHYGRERIGATRNLDSWAFAFDYEIPFHTRLTLRGEGFVGSNLVPFQGGVLQGAAVFQPSTLSPPTAIHRIGAGGGWTELTVNATTDYKNVFYLGAGTDDPRDRHLLPNTGRAKNTFAWISYFRKLTRDTTAAIEWSNWQFKTDSFVAGRPGPRGPAGRANVFNLSLAYQF